MLEEIMAAPGLVWEYLNKNGETSVYKIKKDLNIPDSQLYVALGWLAKEGKLDISREGGSLKAKLISR